MKIGLVDLDTSHPGSWVPILRDLNHQVVGVFDSGDVHGPGYADKFAADHRIPRVFQSLDELAEAVDLGIVHGCDWDMHVPRAGKLVQRGKAVLIDKPMAGCLADLDTLLEWSRRGVRLAGGSSLVLCDEAVNHVKQHGPATTAVASCGLGPFDYGIHAYSLVFALMGVTPLPVSVQWFGHDTTGRAMIHWPDGRVGMVITGNENTWMPFQAMAMNEKGSWMFTVDSASLYANYLRRVLPYLAGEMDRLPIPMTALACIERCAIAARVSRLRGNERIVLETLVDDVGGYDGAAFARRYRSLKYPALTK